MSTIDKQAVQTFLLDLQNRICDRFESLDDGATFVEDAWDRPQGGGGKTRVLNSGTLFEKAAPISHMCLVISYHLRQQLIVRN